MRLFVDRGYASTTIESIAAEAGVAVQTVYFVFGNKRALLADVLDVAIAGDDAPVPVLERAWVDEVRAEPDPARAVAAIAHHGCQIIRREAPLYRIIRGAAASDPEVAGLLAVYQQRRLSNLSELVRLVGGKGILKPGLDRSRAADILFALFSYELFQLFVLERDWPEPAWEAWIADVLVAQLLP